MQSLLTSSMRPLALYKLVSSVNVSVPKPPNQIGGFKNSIFYNFFSFLCTPLSLSMSSTLIPPVKQAFSSSSITHIHLKKKKQIKIFSMQICDSHLSIQFQPIRLLLINLPSRQRRARKNEY